MSTTLGQLRNERCVSRGEGGRQRDRQTGRQADKQRLTYSHRERDRERDTHTDTDRQRGGGGRGGVSKGIASNLAFSRREMAA